MTRAERDLKYEEYLRGHSGSDPRILSYDSLLREASSRRVRVLGGYSGLGYQDPAAVRHHVEDIVRKNGDRALYVIGGTKDGIGEAYEWIRTSAREAGFSDVRTAGIVSREAALYPDGIAKQDYLVFVDADVGVWEVKQDGVSLMVDIAEKTGGEMIFFKGGAIAGVEIQEALARGVHVTIYASSDIQPNRERLAKKRRQDPNTIADGTAAIVGTRHPFLAVL
ncbi:MAG TPA: hypothetical protein VIG29_17490 [Vicinamibacteria bacterium]|jgi:hypothetical protein